MFGSKANKIRVFIIAKSFRVRDQLIAIINSDPSLELIGFEETGKKYLHHFFSQGCPDVLLMDAEGNMEIIQKIMQTHPIPIIVLQLANNSTISFKAIEAGALAVLTPPERSDDPDYEKKAGNVIETIKTMAGLQLVTRRPTTAVAVKKETFSRTPMAERAEDISFPILAVAIGASLGGPPAIASILSALPHNFSVPIFIAQHISEGFAESFAKWLAGFTPLNVKVGRHGERALPGNVYVVPDHAYMEIAPGSIITCRKSQDTYSVAPLFRSMARVYKGQAVGIILTGMGKDGAEEMLLMKQAGAYTIAQSEEGCLMFSMPRAAIELGAIKRILPLEEIAVLLEYLVFHQ